MARRRGRGRAQGNNTVGAGINNATTQERTKEQLVDDLLAVVMDPGEGSSGDSSLQSSTLAQLQARFEAMVGPIEFELSIECEPDDHHQADKGPAASTSDGKKKQPQNLAQQHGPTVMNTSSGNNNSTTTGNIPGTTDKMPDLKGKGKVPDLKGKGKMPEPPTDTTPEPKEEEHLERCQRCLQPYKPAAPDEHDCQAHLPTRHDLERSWLRFLESRRTGRPPRYPLREADRMHEGQIMARKMFNNLSLMMHNIRERMKVQREYDEVMRKHIANPEEYPLDPKLHAEKKAEYESLSKVRAIPPRDVPEK